MFVPYFSEVSSHSEVKHGRFDYNPVNNRLGFRTVWSIPGERPMNPGQLGLGSSRPGSARPDQLGRVNSALYIGIYSFGFSKLFLKKGTDRGH